VREKCGIPGTSVKTTFLCRDKPSMKEALRGRRPCAQSIGSASVRRDPRVRRAVGYPLIVKPRDAAGASGTARRQRPDLERARSRARGRQGRLVAVEEFIEGHEGFYDTLTIGGRVVHDFARHYYPNVLEAMRTRWISPQFIATNRIDSRRGYTRSEMGQKVITALGIETTATHMEWFYGPEGAEVQRDRLPSARRARVGPLRRRQRHRHLPRVGDGVVHGKTSQRLSRRFAAGIIALRPDRDGRITGYEGVDEVAARFGQWFIDDAPAAAGHAHPARRGRLHGQRVDAPQAPRLRRAPPHARHRRTDGEGRAPRMLALPAPLRSGGRMHGGGERREARSGGPPVGGIRACRGTGARRAISWGT
jgi:hypothetical protein